MTHGAPWAASAALTLGIAFMSLGLAPAADGDMMATIEKPAVLTVPVPASARADQQRQLILDVTEFQPPVCPADEVCAVQAVVKAATNSSGGPPQEIGRFSITPNAQFRVANPLDAQRFGFVLPANLARGGPLKIYVYLVSSGPETAQANNVNALADARLKLGGAEID